MEHGKARIWHTAIVVLGILAITFGLGTLVVLQSRADADPVDTVVEEPVEHDFGVRTILNAMPRCITSCIWPRITHLGCAHSDHACLCQKFQALDDPCVVNNTTQPTLQSCLEECNYEAQWATPGLIVDSCEAIGVRVVLPDYMMENLRIYGRQFGSSGSFGASFEQITEYITSTTTLPWGVPATKTTESFGRTLIINIGIEDTSIRTITETSTLASDAAGYTSIISGTNYAVTKIIGLAQGAARTDSPTGTGTSSSRTGRPAPDPTETSASSGLSSAAKISIGVAVPLVVVLLAGGIGFCIWKKRRARRNAVPFPMPPAETHDGGLPEHVSHIPQKPPPMSEAHKYPAPYMHNSSGGVGPQIYEMDKNPPAQVLIGPDGQPIHELNQNPPSQQNPLYGSDPQVAHELNTSASSPRHELTAAHGTPRTELPEMPLRTYSPAVGRKPVSQPAVTPSAFPPPWENSDPGFMAPHTEGASAAELRAGPSGPISSTAEDEELRQMEEEMERVKRERERLQNLQALEAREEELKKTIAERRKAGGGGPA